jgi:3-hydroxy-9,10-secoandrosta-1,3,5(10)-triene-9,17-dione monooxygenase reductase component
MKAVDFRRLMGFWATGVSVITAQGDQGPAGATANALSSLSLEPPLALVCFDLSSRTLAAVRESERFGINMLSAGQEDVSRLFATKKSQEEKFAEIDHHLVQGVPVIDDCLAYLVCGLDSELRRGDHVIAIGQVLESGVDEDAAPLLFYRSEYLQLPENDRVS